ncbi:LTA synthase family protein [Bacillus sp. DTU_2020_1000418_1_SI_GHA_SEK_038]|uniref:LTA synthase family protein n=1 Tax=Bacillus sp. DTU_2020_1000418_1_SI_GHA_SEK_038 TaxID=3077585 RepID=UPI0028ECFA15|nr:LTA synthase family protein [Bacillus sp. DTU_2020_1000418_1_SI_GHA_SEK_038]WNS77290.1 LTA synthase family protein [Bacillus sp. DTU_2020_1000418_1_SI_GHA_SEK_038]
MKKLLPLTKELMKEKRMRIFFFIVILFWLKTYAAYRIEFSLGIDNKLQEFLLILNPLSSALLFLGFALFFKGRLQSALFITMNFLMSFLLYANIVYYRFFDDFITVPVIMQTKTNGGQLGESALSLMSPFDVFYFIDTIILAIFVFKKWYNPSKTVSRKPAKYVITAAILTFIINLGLAESDRPQLLTRSFDRNYLVKYLGAYNFSVYDVIQNARSASQRALADSNDITEVENYIKANYAAPNPEYFGKAKGMNVIYISLESLQTFIIDYKLNGQEVTPFLNSLAHNGETFYFDNIINQTGQGKTSDAEFIMDNSLYPMSQGSVYVTKAQNTYHAAPAILKTHGYTSAAFHGNYKTFWNRNEMYRSLGYDHFFDAEYYDMSEENTKNYGMKDKPFFTESMPLLESLPQPFYTKFITLSNHFPFKMDEGDTAFPAAETDNKVVNQYFQSAHYMDQAIEQFFNDLKASGLYDNTVIVMYGDHYGISENHNDAMAEIIGKEVTPFEYARNLQRIPVFIHVPGVEGGAQHQIGGQVDVRPTVLHLLGIDTKDYLEIGSDLLSEKHREIVPFRNGDFVSPKVTQVDEKFYSNETGELVDGEEYAHLVEKAKAELQISDNIVYKDLLRFYQPDGFEPINRNDYQYIKKEDPILSETGRQSGSVE